MIAPYDDIGNMLAENPAGAFRQVVESWSSVVSDGDVLDGLELAGFISPAQRQLATIAVQAARDTGLPYLAVDLALALGRLNLRVPLADDPGLAAAVAVAWARR